MYYSSGLGDAGPPAPRRQPDRAHRTLRGPRDVLTPDLPFAIDPSPYRDPSGTWWLFYATDLVEGDRPGTVLAVQRLDGMTRLVGSPEVVLRATGGLAALRGRPRDLRRRPRLAHARGARRPRRRRGRLLLLYSGGNWQTPGYGVAVATASTPEGPWHEDLDPRAGGLEREHRAHRPRALQRPRRRRRRAAPLPPRLGPHPPAPSTPPHAAAGRGRHGGRRAWLSPAPRPAVRRVRCG